MATLNCFVIMPFSGQFDPVFTGVKRIVETAIPGEVINCHWLKNIQAAGRISDDILRSLHESVLTVADVTGCNPNVMWETGYAMALGKPTILIARNIGDLPFDLKVHRVIDYGSRPPAEFDALLAEAVRQTMAQHESKLPPQGVQSAQTGKQAIVVTGSMRADPPRVRHRIETLLAPYLGSGVTWYCGSSGTVDEEALNYLLSSGEAPVVVAYHRYDFSDRIRDLVTARKVPFVDASIASLPKGIVGPSERDVFYCAKGDLIVLLWDGESTGTRELISYFQSQGRNMLVGFV